MRIKTMAQHLGAFQLQNKSIESNTWVSIVKIQWLSFSTHDIMLLIATTSSLQMRYGQHVPGCIHAAAFQLLLYQIGAIAIMDYAVLYSNIKLPNAQEPASCVEMDRKLLFYPSKDARATCSITKLLDEKMTLRYSASHPKSFSYCIPATCTRASLAPS